MKFTLLFFLLSTAFAQNRPSLAATTEDKPRNLREAIATAVKYNAKTVSTDQFLESLNYTRMAAKASLYPSATFSCGKNWYRGSMSTNKQNYDSDSKNVNCGFNISAVIFDGGALLNSYKSVEASVEATKAAYNTTDSLIPNTRGGLAYSTMMAYSQLVMMQAYVKTTEFSLAALEEFRKVDNSANLNVRIANTKQFIQQHTDLVESSRDTLTYLVTQAPADEIENLDQTIESLKIPETAESAISLALSNGPEVLRRNLNVKMAEYSLKAIRASLGPQVSVYSNWNKSNIVDNQDSFNDSRSSGRNIGVSVSIPFGFSGIYSAEAASKNLESKKSERQAAIEDAQNSIIVTYKTLARNRKLYLAMSENYDNQLKLLQSLIERIQLGDTSGLKIADLMTTVGNLEGQAFQVLNVQQNIMMDLFSIQQTTGLLFTNFAMAYY